MSLIDALLENTHEDVFVLGIDALVTISSTKSLSAADKQVVESKAKELFVAALFDESYCVNDRACHGLITMGAHLGPDMLEQEGLDPETLLEFLKHRGSNVRQFAVHVLALHCQFSKLDDRTRLRIEAAIAEARKKDSTLASRMLCVTPHREVVAAADDAWSKVVMMQY
eukprot:gnl/TRDRNA2_/TRDRNA2_156204_c3_seq2.p1 gnl/TRDRNA2_/TRDRNA2_156204_c3~~gnl/TRDRNA2_/TRDRNA2_156204_c3_seq2.p1  ORF type:complete len:169 (+),score=33.67 gnl/TRDRNA2_/TRDRNA2_156204_c3_seq2:115-621(+)